MLNSLFKPLDTMAQPPPPAKGGAPAKTGMFGSKKPPAPPPVTPNEDMNILARRLRLLEERYSRVEHNLHNIEDHLGNLTRDFNRMLIKIKKEVEVSTGQIDQMQDRMMMFIKELELLAKQEDVDVIRKYLKYWEPVKYVQVSHVESIIKDVLSEMGIIEKP